MIIKTPDRTIIGYWYNDTSINYMCDGTANISRWVSPNLFYFTYYKNGTTTQRDQDGPEILVIDTSVLPYTTTSYGALPNPKFKPSSPAIH
jgi:hypothetical protein